jgi:hypothetical protein
MKIVKQLIFAVVCLVATCPDTYAAPQISGEMVGNVTTTSATLCWEVSEPATSGVKIYSDAAGSQEITGEMAIEISPLIANRREIRSTPAGREMNRQIKSAMSARQVALVKVTGLTPGASYWMRCEALDGSGAVRDASALLPVTTAERSEFVIESRQLVVDLTAAGAIAGGLSGTVVVVANDDSPYPLFSVIGDGLSGDRAYMDLTHFLTASGETTLIPASGSLMNLTISLKGSGDLSGNFEGNEVGFNGESKVASASTTNFIPENLFLVAVPDRPTALQGRAFTVDLRANDALGDPLVDFNRALTFTNASIATGSLNSSPLVSGILNDQEVVLSSPGNQAVIVSDPVSGKETSFNVEVLAYNYDNYRRHYFGDLVDPNGDPNANGDGDPFDNFQEFAYGLNPAENDGALLLGDGFNIIKRGGPVTSLRFESDGVDFRVTFLRPKNYQELGLNYSPRFSADLATWFDVATDPEVIGTDGEMELVSVPYPFFTPDVRKARFFNVAVSIP